MMIGLLIAAFESITGRGKGQVETSKGQMREAVEETKGEMKALKEEGEKGNHVNGEMDRAKGNVKG
ncbi:MAG: hypothetical protein AB7P19_16245, partial [Nitrospira sp.]